MKKSKSSSLRKNRSSQTGALKIGYDLLEPRQLLAADFLITEFQASNSSTLVNDSGNDSDWIEIYNAGTSSGNLAGFSLTDNSSNPTKWTFPSVTVQPDSFLVVFADDDAAPNTGSDLYTGFSLSASGEYLGLFDVSGTVVSQYNSDAGEYPPQQSDGSYGLAFSNASLIEPVGEGYFENPTPGAANSNQFAGLVQPVQFSVEAGFFDTEFSLSLTTATNGATIRYTLDGSEPTLTNGFFYNNSLSIDETTNVRARGYRNGFIDSNIETQTYFFLDDVLDQSNDGLAPTGWPADWGSNVVDYGIDPQVRQIEGDQAIKDALLAIPSWSITTDLDNLFDDATGIYSNALRDGIDWERPASVELIQPDGTEGFQVDAGLRIRGGFSRLDNNPKHSFRLIFRGEYGDSELNFPVHGESGTDTFDKIDLRTAQNYSWSKDGDPNNNFIQDVISRQNQGLTGQPYTRSSWLHLYLNGQYWGLFQTQERVDSDFAASYLGGDKDDYDVIKVDAGPGAPRTIFASDGNLDAFSNLAQQTYALDSDGSTPNFVNNEAYLRVQGLNLDGTRNESYEALLDVDNLIDYMTEIFYSGNFDAPITNFGGNDSLNNWQAIRDRTGDEGFQYFVHDAEHSLRTLGRDRTGPYNHSEFERFRSFNPQTLHQKLMANAEYRIAFADSIQEKFFNDGIYTTENIIQRWDAEAAKISSAIIGESARWGDADSNTPLLKSNWEQAIANVRNNILANRNEVFLGQLRNAIIELKDGNGEYTIAEAAPLFPDVDAPTFLVDGQNQNGGEVTPGASLTFSADNTIYYTTDGTDPRLTGGGINPNAIAFDASNTTTTVIPYGSEWNYLDDGSNQGSAWRSPSFNDSSWASGASELGFGDDPETTISFGSDSNNKHITTYFRKTFEINENFDTAALEVFYDDGAVVFLNGQEIGRANLDGVVDWQTPAESAVGDGTTAFFDITNFLQVGTNTLAVEIHQVSGRSSDLSFNAQLIVSSEVSQADGIPLITSTNVRARAFDNGEWSAENNAIFAIPVSQSDLRISELHFNPADPTDAEIAAGYNDNDDFEFIEIYNPSTTGTINLSGVQLSDGVIFEFGDTNLLPGERAVIVEDVDAFMERYGDTATVLGQWSGALNNGGEKVTLVDSSLEEIMSIDYGENDPWYNAANGHGFSLVLEDPANTAVDELGKYYSWTASTLLGGTPGEASLSPAGVVVNEVLAHTDSPQSDSIELFNTTNAPISVSGWYLSDEGDDLFKYQIPNGTVIAAGGYLVFDESDFNATSTGFALSSEGDQVYLSQNIAGFILLQDAVEFDATFNGESLGRLPDGTGRLTRLAETSFGSVNGEAESGPLVISEVNYHPATPSATALAIDSTLIDNDLEYIEIANPTSADVDLTNWRIRGEADYDFASGTILLAGEAIVVVSFEPAIETAKLNAFRAHYGIGSGVRIVGGLSASLSNSTGRIALQQPDLPDALGEIPNVVVDELVYDDLLPWPDADGSGLVLERDDLEANGNLATSWVAAVPTPGAFETSFLLGDANLDGVVDFGDISRFISLLQVGTFLDQADTNRDGLVNFLDISPFISILSS